MDNQLIAKEQSGRFFFLSDKLSVRAILDGNGAIIGRQAHLPFGEEVAASGTQEKHHFTSYESDSESVTDYAVNRQYTQGTGRFLAADPYQASGGIDNPQSWNRYSYALNDPVHHIDPLGLFVASPREEYPCDTPIAAPPFQGPGEIEIKLKHVEIHDEIKTYEFGTNTVSFNLRGLACDGEEVGFPLNLALAIFDEKANWRVLGIDFIGELVQIRTTQLVEHGAFAKEVRLRLRWDNKDEVDIRKSKVTIRIEATRSSVFDPKRSTAAANLRMTCTN